MHFFATSVHFRLGIEREREREEGKRKSEEENGRVREREDGEMSVLKVVWKQLMTITK